MPNENTEFENHEDELDGHLKNVEIDENGDIKEVEAK